MMVFTLKMFMMKMAMDCDDTDDPLLTKMEILKTVTEMDFIGEDCDDGDYSIGYKTVMGTGHLEDCSGTDCLSILENVFSLGDGVYWIAPYDMEPFEIYCDMTTEGGGWILFSDIHNVQVLLEVYLYMLEL